MAYSSRSTTNGEIATNVNLFQRLKDAYLGSGDFANGRVLIKHARETKDGYERRKSSVSYANYFRPLIDVTVNAIYGKTPMRGTRVDDVQWSAFVENVDGRNNLSTFMRKVCITGKKLGSAWVFMDNSPEPANNVEEAVRDRKLPYMFIVEPHMIKNFTMTPLGQLTSVSYYEQHYNAVKGEYVYYTRVWTNEEIYLADENMSTIEKTENNLGVIPCMVFIGSGQELEEGEVPFPEYTNIYQLNTKIVNVDSLITNGLYQQGFSILLLAGEFDNTLEIGESAAINYDKLGTGTVDAPSFISPDPSPIDLMMKYMDLLKTQIQEQSIADFTTTKSESQSGIAKRIDNLNRSEALENLAQQLEQIELRIAQMFGMYINKDLGYEVEYYKNYDIDDIKTRLEEAHLALGIQWSSTEVVKAIKEEQIRGYFSEWEQADIDALVDAENRTEEVSNVVDEVEQDVQDGQEQAPVSPAIDSTNDEIKALLTELKAAIDANKVAIEEAKAVKDETDKAAQDIVINNTQNTEVSKSEANVENVKSMISKVLYDLRIGNITEDQAKVVIKSYGFDDDKIEMILSKVRA